MSDLSSLIAEIEQATEGSAELDDRIAYYFSHNHYGWWAYRAGPSEFTRTLDAAMTLVPPGLSASATRRGDGGGSAEIWRWAPERFADIPGGYESEDLRRRNGSFTHQNVGAATPALALVAACLRARMASAELTKKPPSPEGNGGSSNWRRA